MKTILLIDDDESIRSIFRRFLERHGYEVQVAADGLIALEMLDHMVPDLVITDVIMPEKDGLEVALELKNRNPDIPVIAISGGMRVAPMDFLPVISKFGAKKILYKPVDLEVLLAAVQEQFTDG